MAYDTETSGLDWKRHSAVGYVFTIEGESIYIPVRHGGGGNLYDPNVPPLTTPEDITPDHWFEKELAAAFAVRNALGYLTVGHHIQFDALFSWKHGIQIGRNLYDTQNMATMLNEHQDSFSLESTAVVFGVTPKLGKQMYEHLSRLFGGRAEKGQMAHFWRTSGSDPVVVDYAGGDGVTTLELYPKQMKYIQEEGLERICDVENRLIWTLVRMEHRGWKIANDRFAEVLEEVDRKLTEARAKLPYGFNVRSSAAVRALAERAGHTTWSRTKPTKRFPEGQPQFNEAFLEGFEEGRAVLRVRRLEKLIGTFILPLRDKHMWNGRVHGHLNQLKADEYGTISGRLSASSPNLQQVLSRDKELATLYRLLFAADEGMLLYEADYSQIEPRLWGVYSLDPWLNEGYRADPPIDVHQIVADLIQGDRQTAKPINLGLFYLMGKASFNKHMQKFFPGVSQEQTDLWWEGWYAKFTRVRDFQNDATKIFRNRGYVTTILGRRARVKPGDNRFYVASNRIIQGSSADITKERLLFIDLQFEAAGDLCHLLMTVHDSIIYQCPEHDKVTPGLVKAWMADLGGAPYNLKMPIVVDQTVGRDWAEVKFNKEEA